MKLNVQNRLVLMSILPVSGNAINLKLLRVLRESLSFNEKEIKMLNLVEKDGMVTWKPDHRVKDKEVEIGAAMTELIVKALKALDEKEELLDVQMNLYDIFIK